MKQSLTSTTRKPPLLNNMLKLFMVAMILANIASNMYVAILPLYLKHLNASVVQVGLFFTLSQIVPLALQILGGWISDTLGRLRCIALGSLAGSLAHFSLILAPTWQWVLMGEGLNSLTRSLVGPSFGAFIAEQSTEETRARVYSITDTIYSVVIIIGPPLGGWLVDNYGFKFMLFIAWIVYTTATIIRVYMARKAVRDEKSEPQALSLTTLRANLGLMLSLIVSGGFITWLLVTDGARDVAYSMSSTLMPLYLEELGGLNMQQIGMLSSVFGITQMLITMPGGWLADKKGERVAIVLGFLLNFAALITFLEVNTFFGYAAAWGIWGLGSGLMSPAYQSLISKAIPAKVRGTAFGLLDTSLGLFSLPAPAIGAQLWQHVGPRVPFLITAAVSLVTIIPAWFKFRLPDKTEPENTTSAYEGTAFSVGEQSEQVPAGEVGP